MKFPIKAEETEREWRLDDGDEPIVEKEWKLDDIDDNTSPTPSHDLPQSEQAAVETNPVQPEPNPAPETVATLPENPPPTSPQNDATPTQSPKKSHWKVYAALLGAAGLSVWFSHQSINAYWQQTYHKASPLEPLNHFALWKMGAKAQNALNDLFTTSSSEEMANDVPPPSQSPNHTHSEDNPSGTLAETPTPTHATQPETPNVDVAPANSNQQGEQAVWLNAGDKVMFVGDSIMQGIAPHLQRRLKSDYQIDSLNLSKQSTGLAYPKFFDWPSTIEQNLQKDPSIKLLVVLLGANDPWDFPNPQGGAYLKFQSPEWNQEYLNRVNRIIQAAEKNQARIIWLGVPYMRRQDLDKGVRHLNQILGNELVNKSPTVIWLPTDMLLSDSEGYQDSMTIDGEVVRIRTKDGIHLNTAGQIFMSNYLSSYIKSK